MLCRAFTMHLPDHLSPNARIHKVLGDVSAEAPALLLWCRSAIAATGLGARPRTASMTCCAVAPTPWSAASSTKAFSYKIKITYT
jgi:hypothetical protein